HCPPGSSADPAPPDPSAHSWGFHRSYLAGSGWTAASSRWRTGTDHPAPAPAGRIPTTTTPNPPPATPATPDSAGSSCPHPPPTPTPATSPTGQATTEISQQPLPDKHRDRPANTSSHARRP